MLEQVLICSVYKWQFSPRGHSRKLPINVLDWVIKRHTARYRPGYSSSRSTATSSKPILGSQERAIVFGRLAA